MHSPPIAICLVANLMTQACVFMHTCLCREMVTSLLLSSMSHGTLTHRKHMAVSMLLPGMQAGNQISGQHLPRPVTYLAGDQLISSQHLRMCPLHLHLLQHRSGLHILLQKLHRLAECSWLVMQQRSKTHALLTSPSQRRRPTDTDRAAEIGGHDAWDPRYCTRQQRPGAMSSAMPLWALSWHGRVLSAPPAMEAAGIEDYHGWGTGGPNPKP